MTVRSPRAGYTLVEMVLVLAIIVLLAAITYPSLNGMYADLKVQAAADEVRAQCVTARTQAVNEGRPYAFAVMPGGDRSRVAPVDLTTGGAASDLEGSAGEASAADNLAMGFHRSAPLASRWSAEDSPRLQRPPLSRGSAALASPRTNLAARRGRAVRRR